MAHRSCKLFLYLEAKGFTRKSGEEGFELIPELWHSTTLQTVALALKCALQKYTPSEEGILKRTLLFLGQKAVSERNFVGKRHALSIAVDAALEGSERVVDFLHLNLQVQELTRAA